ncbi:MAG: GGDEF domain-containing protein [Steroidobacteraceae bacterium]
MNAEFEARLSAQVDFPSPSKVAMEVIGLARDPDIEIGKVATAIGKDPAMAAKLLRIANSAFYAQRRPSQNIRQSLVIIGLNAALTLALSFSLVSTLRGCKPNGIDYRRYWRRTLLAATASRAFAERVCKGRDEDAFLTGLLQDVAILAIDRTSADFYEQLPKGASHSVQIKYEQERLDGKDHAHYGGILLKAWNLPAPLCYGVEHSHRPDKADFNSDEGKVARCVALGSELAEVALAEDRSGLLPQLAGQAAKLLSLRGEQFTEVVTRVLKLIPEAEELYETSILDAGDAETLLAQARELMTVRNLTALRDVQALQETAAVLMSRTEELEDTARRDPLTGTLNRMWLERMLEREYTQAVMFSRSLSIAFVNLDHFKRINEKTGHEGGDRVLKSCADTLQANIRGSDMLGRYSGDTFLVILPGTDEALASQVCTRMLSAIKELPHATNQETLKITASAGIATYTPRHRFTNASELLQAADHALYRAKLSGRNRVERFDAPISDLGTPDATSLSA